MSVPDEIALIGYSNQYPHIYQAAGLQLTTVQQLLDRIGELAVKCLCQPHAVGEVPFRQLLQPKLVIRQSCGYFSEAVYREVFDLSRKIRPRLLPALMYFVFHAHP